MSVAILNTFSATNNTDKKKWVFNYGKTLKAGHACIFAVARSGDESYNFTDGGGNTFTRVTTGALKWPQGDIFYCSKLTADTTGGTLEDGEQYKGGWSVVGMTLDGIDEGTNPLHVQSKADGPYARGITTDEVTPAKNKCLVVAVGMETQNKETQSSTGTKAAAIAGGNGGGGMSMYYEIQDEAKGVTFPFTGYWASGDWSCIVAVFQTTQAHDGFHKERRLENLNGITFDVREKKTIFAEDINAIKDRLDLLEAV